MGREPQYPASGGLRRRRSWGNEPFLNSKTGGEIIAKNSENLAIIYDDVTINCGGLASKAAAGTSSKIDASRENGFRVIKTEYWMDYLGKTTAQGPVMVGFAPNLGVTEIAETINADPQSKVLDSIEAESKRPVFPLEMITEPETSTENQESWGAKGTFNPRWSVPEGSAATWFCFNMDGAALTTGLIVRIFAKHYGVWLND